MRTDDFETTGRPGFTASALMCLVVLMSAGCERVRVEMQGETMVARPTRLIPISGVAGGLVVVALGVLVASNGKSASKRLGGGALFIGLGAVLAVSSVMSYSRFYATGNGERIVQSQVLFGDPKTTELDPVTHVSLYRVLRRRSGGSGPKRRWVTLLWLHRPDGEIDRIEMSGYLNRPVREHVLTKLRERGVRIEDFRDQTP